MPQVEVTFDIDANGLLNVSAKDKATNKEQKITIQSGTGLSDAEVEKMVKDAEANKAEDKKKKEQVEARNMADGLTYTAEKTLKDLGDKMDKVKKEEIEKLVKEIRDGLSTLSVEDLKSKTQELSSKLQEVGSAMYGNQQKQGNNDAGTGSSDDKKKEGEGPIDAEVEESK